MQRYTAEHFRQYDVGQSKPVLRVSPSGLRQTPEVDHRDGRNAALLVWFRYQLNGLYSILEHWRKGTTQGGGKNNRNLRLFNFKMCLNKRQMFLHRVFIKKSNELPTSGLKARIYSPTSEDTLVQVRIICAEHDFKSFYAFYNYMLEVFILRFIVPSFGFHASERNHHLILF